MFEVGRELDLGAVLFDEATVARYLAAVQDEAMAELCGDSSPRMVPPLELAVQFLHGITQMELPLEALHTGQELDFLKAVPVDSTVHYSGRVASNRRRGEIALVQVEFEGHDDMGDLVIRGKTNILLPAEE